ncbi:MAG: hypothetical protein WA751_06145 [Candidatus Dormiibacterota bacterium]
MQVADTVWDQPQTDGAKRLQQLTGALPPSATSLVERAAEASVDQMLANLSGSAPVPSTLTNHLAQHLYFTCTRANRNLNPQEIQVLYRVNPAQARAILTAMNACYAQALHSQRVTRMRVNCSKRRLGTNNALQWEYTFTDDDAYQCAQEELRILSLLPLANSVDALRKVTIDQNVPYPPGSGKMQPVSTLLGIP